MSSAGFVPADFDPPRERVTPAMDLVPLGVEHNESDHGAWRSSIAHVRATPGFESAEWPPTEGMSLDADRGDLQEHARDRDEHVPGGQTTLNSMWQVMRDPDRLDSGLQLDGQGPSAPPRAHR